MRETITLYEEFRLIERSENDVSVAWKGAHLLLFFLAFVFGSACCFCFHILMYMFDQKCVLFPKIVSQASLRQVIYEYYSVNEKPLNEAHELPVDFISTQWVENSVCYLPTYVPLLSGIFGLIWTTMYLMCSSTSTNLTGMQRQWRAFPPIFVFSVAMGALCIYTSVITQTGLDDLCEKLAKITGSSSCTYTVNVATIAYLRRIRGVYQATVLTVTAAWLHTACWLLSALLTLLRVVFVIDFQLVRVKAELIGDVNRMLEKYEKQIRSVSPDALGRGMSKDSISSDDSHVERTAAPKVKTGKVTINTKERVPTHNDRHFMGLTDTIFMTQKQSRPRSEMSLVPEEQYKLARISAYRSVPKKHQFIVKLIYSLLETIPLPESGHDIPQHNFSEITSESSGLSRQKGTSRIGERSSDRLSQEEAKELALEVRRTLRQKLKEAQSQQQPYYDEESAFNLLPELKDVLETKEKENTPDALETKQKTSPDSPEPSTSKKKSNLRTKNVQTGHKVQLMDPVETFKFDDSVPEGETQDVDDNTNEDSKKSKKDQETQTTKEKQD